MSSFLCSAAIATSVGVSDGVVCFGDKAVLNNQPEATCIRGVSANEAWVCISHAANGIRLTHYMVNASAFYAVVEQYADFDSCYVRRRELESALGAPTRIDSTTTRWHDKENPKLAVAFIYGENHESCKVVRVDASLSE